MAQIKVLYIASDGVSLEHSSGSDEITFLTGQFGNVNMAGNSIISTDTNGNLILTPDGTGDLVLDGLNWPQADGTANQVIETNGAGQLSFVTPASTAALNVCNPYTVADVGGVALGDLVYISAADSVTRSDVSAAGIASRVMGMTDAAAADTASVDVCSEGVVTGLSGLTAGARYFANPAVAGGMTVTTPVGTGNTIVQAGYAKSATAFHLHIEQLGRRA